MKTPTKFVKPLTDEQRTQLKEIMKSQAQQRKRMRAHAVLLSERRYSIDQIADIYQVDRDRVSEWLDWWEEYQFDGLDDDPRGGRPTKLTEKEQWMRYTGKWLICMTFSSVDFLNRELLQQRVNSTYGISTKPDSHSLPASLMPG